MNKKVLADKIFVFGVLFSVLYIVLNVYRLIYNVVHGSMPFNFPFWLDVMGIATPFILLAIAVRQVQNQRRPSDDS